MILTLTPSPCLDRTLDLPGPLAPGEVTRLAATRTEPGGKGLNVARLLAAQGHEVLTLAPAAATDPWTRAVRALEAGPARAPRLATTPVAAPVRTNTTLTEPGGRTTKLNEAGTPPTPAELGALEEDLARLAPGASWVVLAGSQPAGAPARWLPHLLALLRQAAPGARLAVDTSGQALRDLAATLDSQAAPDLLAPDLLAPDLLAPNATEIATLAGLRPEAGAELEEEAAHGRHDRLLQATDHLLSQGVGELLVTLGAAGALLATPGGAWHAPATPVTTRSTVGAGDAALAAYTAAALSGAGPADRLAHAVAAGSAAAALPGTGLPLSGYASLLRPHEVRRLA